MSATTSTDGVRPAPKVRRQWHSVEPLNIDTKGYGPNGTFTRKEWRDLCRSKLLGDEQDFSSWIGDLSSHSSELSAEFGALIDFGDGNGKVRFSPCRLPSITLDFVGSEFPSSVLFKVSIVVPVLFSYATFKDQVKFFQTEFDVDEQVNGLDFEGTRFLKSAHFHAIHVKGPTSFIGATFRDHVHFVSCEFSGPLNYSNAEFHESATFSDLQCGGLAIFIGSNFSSTIDFTRANFSLDLSFDEIQVCGFAQFDHVKFNSGANFTKTIFHSDASFHSGTFSSDAIFDHSKIGGTASFRTTSFEGDAYFHNVVFLSLADFFDTEFQERCHFENTTFGSECIFENARFKKGGHFEEVTFREKSPSFLGVDPKSSLFFLGAEFPKYGGVASDEKHYTALKQITEAQGHHELALELNARVLKAKRRDSCASWHFKVSSWLYETFSDFGRSYMRPFTWLLVFMLANLAIDLTYAALNSPVECTSETCWWLRLNDLDRVTQPSTSGGVAMDAYRAGIEHTLIGALGIPEISGKAKLAESVNHRLFGQEIEPLCIRMWNLIRAILNILLLFLVGLGLRNAYRLK